MWGVAGRPESVMDPPHMAKNKFLLNEYLGIFMHFESIFFIFLNLENGLFQTHPPTKSGKFQIFFFFLNPSLSVYFTEQWMKREKRLNIWHSFQSYEDWGKLLKRLHESFGRHTNKSKILITILLTQLN